MSAGAHVVFGTGPAGRAVAAALVEQGARVRMVIIDVYAVAGMRRTDVTTLKRPMLCALGLFNRNVRELLHTYYQFDAPFVVDDSAFRNAFGGYTTGWDDIVTSTVDWYRAHAKTPELSTGLAEATTEKVTA